MKKVLVGAAALALVACQSSADSSVKEDPRRVQAEEVPLEQVEGGDDDQLPMIQKMKLVCTIYDDNEDLGNTQVVLTQLDNLEVSDGNVNTFLFEMYDGISMLEDKRAELKVETYDVHFSGESADGKVSLTTYLDEMDQMEIAIDGEKIGNFMCR